MNVRGISLEPCCSPALLRRLAPRYARRLNPGCQVADFNLRYVIPAALLIASLSSGAQAGNLAESARTKFSHIHQNGQQQRPDPRPTEITEQEVNAYMASGDVRLPAGVDSVRLIGIPGAITGRCRVDF